MDKVTAALIALGVLALVLIAFFAVFRSKGRFKAEGLGVKVQAEGENAPPAGAGTSAPGVRIKNVEAGGNVRAEDHTGRGVDVEGAKAIRGDVTATSESPRPKA